MKKKIGLRIDVDTYKGTKFGVPNLLKILSKYKIHASFFFSVGPDNMGRHLWKLFNPIFFSKMLRTKAISLYGLDILFAGTLWKGKIIFNKLKHIIKQTLNEGHEIGLHAWDHFAWQTKLNKWDLKTLIQQIKLGVDALEDSIDIKVKCSASPSWKINDQALIAKEKFCFDYNSDCRGTHIFRPILNNGLIGTIQIPTTLPTYDEIVGNIIEEKKFNTYIINQIYKNIKFAVYTIHAEVEGISKLEQFDNLLNELTSNNILFCKLNKLIPKNKQDIPINKIISSFVSGRYGWLSYQSKERIC